MTTTTTAAPPAQPAGIVVRGLRKTYGSGSAAVEALRDVQMRVEPGEVVGLVGPSGSGKSTLLKCLGAVLTPSFGHIELGGETVFDGDHWLNPDLTRLRRQQIGFIFQSPYLLPFLNVRDNVALLAMLLGSSNRQARSCCVGGAGLRASRGRERDDLLAAGHVPQRHQRRHELAGHGRGGGVGGAGDLA